MNVNEVAKKLYDKFTDICQTSNDVCEYPGCLVLFAALQTAENTGDTAWLNEIIAFIKKFPQYSKDKVYNFRSYEIGGIAAAYAFYKGYVPELEPIMREYAEEAMHAPRDVHGLLRAPLQNERELVWIDTIMAETPFLLFIGLALGEPAYVDEAVKQAIGHYDLLMDKDIGLLHQCINFVSDGVLTEDHWGRGNGWGLIAMTELVKHLPKSHKDRRKVELYFSKHIHELRKYQTRHGMWRQEIPLEYSYEESSGTGLILYGISVGISQGLLDRNTYMKAVVDGLDGLMTFAITADFDVERCCSGMRCPGFGEDKGTLLAYVNVVPRTNDPHAFGTMMVAFQEASKIGITEANRNAYYTYNRDWDGYTA